MAGYGGINNYGYNFSPIPMKTPQQLQQEYSNLMQQYQSLYNAQYPNTNMNNIMQNSNIVNNGSNPSVQGSYTKVSGYSEVENAPTPTDGTATLFFDFEHGVFWSKKFSNGQHIIQSFAFRPLNQNGDVANVIKEQEPIITKEETMQEPEKQTPKIDLNQLYERLDKIENKLSKISSKQNSDKIQSTTTKQKLVDLEG